MKLKYIADYKSIKQFNEIELDDLTIFTGLNGSGKSHLLESIKGGQSQIDMIPFTEVVLFDYKTFFLDNEQEFNNQQLNEEKNSAWNRFKANNNPNIRATIQSYRNEIGEADYKKILEISEDKPLFGLRKRDFNDPDLFTKFDSYKTKIYNFFRGDRVQKLQEAKGLKSLVLKSPKSIDELDEDEFFDMYTPIILKNDFLPSQIGKMFLDYWYKYQMFEYQWIKKEKEYNEEAFRTDFEKKHGPRPWNLIQEILVRFDSFQYNVNNPEHIIIEPFRTRSFTLSLQHKVSGISIPFSNLSSGEKILFSLVLSIYKSQGDKLFPSVLLLDEIDASLHPSQVQNLLDVINEVFIKQNNVKVIIATHSPSTIAFAEEKNIFIVNTNGLNRIEKQTKKEALKILSEGFITLDEGLQIFDQFSKKQITLFTEGNNISFIKRAIEILAPQLLTEIDIVENLKDRTGKNQMNTLNEFFQRMPHDNKVLFVYDCDVTTNFQETNKTYAFVFDRNDNNQRVKKGIENLFDEALFSEDFYPIKEKDDGGVHSSLDKPKFEKHVVEQGKKEDFKNFKPLITKLENLLAN